MRIIGIVGRAGAGKDSLARTAITHLYPAGLSTSFAGPLKEEIRLAYHMRRMTWGVMLEDRRSKETANGRLALCHSSDKDFVRVAQQVLRVDIWEPLSPRQVMQVWGTEYRRAADPEYWLDRMGGQIDGAIKRGVSHLFITDVRFPNEAEFLRDRGAMLIRITSDDASAPATHASETEASSIDCDVEIHNDKRGLDDPQWIDAVRFATV